MAGEAHKAVKAIASHVDLHAVATHSKVFAQRVDLPALAIGLTIASRTLRTLVEDRRGEHESRPVKEVFTEVKAELASTKLPQEPFRRSIIAVVQPGEEFPAAEDGPGVAWLQVPDRLPSQGLVRSLMQQGKLVPGTVLIQSPIDLNRYHPLDHAVPAVALEKLMAYERVASLLGATSFTVESVEVLHEGRTVSVNADGSLPVGTLAVAADTDVTQKLKSIVSISSKSAPGKVDLDAAENVVADGHLENDEMITSLLNFARDGLHKKEFTMDVGLTEEAAHTVEVGLKVQARLQKANAKVSAVSRKSVLTDVQSKLRVTYDN